MVCYMLQNSGCDIIVKTMISQSDLAIHHRAISQLWYHTCDITMWYHTSGGMMIRLWYHTQDCDVTWPKVPDVYCLILPCTLLVQGGTRLYILVRTAEIWIMSVHTGHQWYIWYVPKSLIWYRDRYKLVHTVTVLYTCTGFQMSSLSGPLLAAFAGQAPGPPLPAAPTEAPSEP